MSFSNFFKKASNFLGLGSPDGNKQPPLDGEIIYCKNNVCVHPPSSLSTEVEHHPGYLTIRAQDDELLGSTLFLTWIPNVTLKKNPMSIENSPTNHPHTALIAPSPKPSPRISPRRRNRKDYAHDDTTAITPSSPGDSGSMCSETSRLHKHEDDGSSSDISVTPDECVRTGNQSLKSQTDSGIGHEELDQLRSSNAGNLKIPSVPFSESREPLLSAASSRVNTPSSDGEAANTELGYAILVSNDTKTQSGVTGANKERNDSNRSVASIELDGDSLVIVTEQPQHDDDAFESEKNNTVNGNSIEAACVDSSHEATIEAAATSLDNHTKNNLEKNTHSLERRSQLTLDLSHSEIDQWQHCTPDITFGERKSSTSSGSTSGPDSNPPTPVSASPASSPSSPVNRNSVLGCASLVAEVLQHNLTFPENSLSYKSSPTTSKRTAKEQMCGVFSVDLGQMRSLRLFYNDHSFTNGQIVIVSRESQYKVLHFHHGGMEKLCHVFEEWKFFAQPNKEKKSSTDHLCKQFSVIRPRINREHYHPEEGLYDVVGDEMWRTHMNNEGQIEEQLLLRKAIFFGGLHPLVRSEAWPFLLHYYPFDSTLDGRERIRNDKYIEYHNIRSRRESMEGEEKEAFWRNIQCIVEKDVVRTDRSHPYFRGEGNPNIDVLKNILLNYAVSNPHLGYTQGMSDLLSPILAELKHEADAYWCFTGLMQRTIFVSSPKDSDMDKQLAYLRDLLRLMLPNFYKHLCKLGDAMDLLFCHRWILLCFKREFPEDDALRIWESCWAHYQTDYFHLFICVAIIAVYGEDVIQQNLPSDEMLLHFSSLSMHMLGDAVLRKARGLLHHFRARRSIPCTLHGLCTLCGPGMWDSGHVPAVRCIGHGNTDTCPYELNTPR